MVKELTDISAFNHTQKKSFHIIIITIAIVTMAILSHIENWSVRVKSVVRFQESALPQLLLQVCRATMCRYTCTHAFTVIPQTICRNVEVIKDFEKPQCFQVKKDGWMEN